MPRTIWTHTLPTPGQPKPGAQPLPEPGPDGGPAYAQRDIYIGPDPWGGEEPKWRSVGVVGLTAPEQIEAAKRCSSPLLYEWECAKVSVVELDGHRPDAMRAEDQGWDRWPPMVREQVVRAYRQHNQSPAVLDDCFLESCVVEYRDPASRGAGAGAGTAG